MNTVNTEKFLEWLQHEEKMERNYEKIYVSQGDYAEAIRRNEVANTYSYLYHVITGEHDTDLAEFIEKNRE